MHRSNFSSSRLAVSFMLVCLLLLVHNSFEFNIPDQHLTFGKIFYYKLNITKEQQNEVTKVDLIKISDSGPSSLPSWLIFQNFTFIGFPVQQDNIKFISIVINSKKHKTLRDVFLINGVDNSQSPSISSGHLPKKNHHSTNNDCEIKLNKAFDTAEDLWNLIVYLMPKHISEIMLNEFDQSNTNQAITEWTSDLFTVNGVETIDGNLAFNLLIANQPCARDLNDFDDIQYKLTKIGVEFSVVKNVAAPEEFNDDEDDEDNQFDKLMFGDMAFGAKNRRQIGRPAKSIYSTPTVYPEWMTMATISRPSEPIRGNDDSTALDYFSRLQPSLSTPELSHTHTIQYSKNEELTSPHYSPASVLSNVYLTPSFAPEPPTDLSYMSKTDVHQPLITPTPTLTFIVSDTARDFSSIDPRFSLESISPSSSTAFQPESSQTLVPTTDTKVPITTDVSLPDVSTSTNKTSSPEPSTSTTTTIPDIFKSTQNIIAKPVTKKPPISPEITIPDHAPMIRERIPKLRLTSGVYWKYVIPEDTFNDLVNGNTRNLELSFAPSDQLSENIAPADLFIQFDRENQVLTALPTEDQIGRHKFLLSAADSSGQMVSDELEITVVQHKLSRSFTHKFMLENVTWHEDIPLVDAVYNLMKKIASLFNDVNINSIFLQKVDPVKTENQKRFWNIFWTNSSLRTYPCPNQEIQSIFSRLAQHDAKFKEGQPMPPSSLLRKTTEPEFKIGHIRVSLASTCSKSEGHLLKDKTPAIRNPIKNITFEFGSVFLYQVPSDTFVSSKQGDTRDLALELVSPSGYFVDKRDCIGFVSENQTIYGLALNENQIEESRDYRLIARVPGSNLNAYDVFVLQILADKTKNQYTHEITLQFKPQINVDMDLLSKVTIANKFAHSLFDGRLSDLKVLRIRKHRYEPQYKSNTDYNRRKREPQSHTSSRTFYEYVISMKNAHASTASCPVEQIQRDIVKRVFNSSNSDLETQFTMLRDLFQPDYELVYVGFRAIGECKNKISPIYMGTKMVAETKSSILDDFSTTVEPFFTVGPANDLSATMRDQDEILLRTIVPALLIILIILFISCLLIVVFVRFRRGHDKNRFDVNTNMHGVGEAESFLQKGRNPVILESDLNPNMHLLHQQVYNQMTPMKQFNGSPYNTAHEPHRRPPPSYMHN